MTNQSDEDYNSKIVESVDSSLTFVKDLTVDPSRITSRVYKVEKKKGEFYVLKFGQNKINHNISKEIEVLEKAKDISEVCNLIEDYGKVTIDDYEYDHVILKDWIDGEHTTNLPLETKKTLKSVMEELHERGVSGLELEYPMNIFVNKNGPKLFDFDRTVIKQHEEDRFFLWFRNRDRDYVKYIIENHK